MVRLDLSLNSMGNEAGVAILGALLNGCTQHLDMSYTALRGVAAGKAIGRMLRCHTIALKFFNAEHNALGREGINEVLVRNKSGARKNENEKELDPFIYLGGTHDVVKRILRKLRVTAYDTSPLYLIVGA